MAGVATSATLGTAALTLALVAACARRGDTVLRRAPRFKDGNHAALRDAWRRLGGSWLDIIPIDGGEPDALVGWRGEDRLIEVKAPGKRPRPDQLEWHRRWKGRPVEVVSRFEELVRLFGA